MLRGGQVCSVALDDRRRARWFMSFGKGLQRAAEGAQSGAQQSQQGCRLQRDQFSGSLLQHTLDRRAGGRLLAPAVGAVAW